MPRDEISYRRRSLHTAGTYMFSTYRRYVENVLKRIMCKKVLTTNPPRKRRKIFFYVVSFCEDPKIDARSPIYKYSLKREESIPTRIRYAAHEY